MKEVQLGRVREALKQSYTDRGWAPGTRGEMPLFRAFHEILKTDPKPDKGLMTRLSELSGATLAISACGSVKGLIGLHWNP